MAVLRSSAPSSHRRASRRLAGAALGVVALIGFTGCGFEVQTNQPYTPSVGVNIDAGENNSLKIRDLKILSREPGRGILSATIIATEPDALVGVGGEAIKSDSSPGAALTATLPQPVAVGDGTLVVLTDRPLITVTSADLLAGLEARVVLRFRSSGEIEVVAPVVDGTAPEFVTISPSPSASASPAAE